MPQFVLRIKADLENVRAMIPAEGNLWKFDIQTPGGGDVRKGITVDRNDELPLADSRGTAHFVIKWPYATDQSYIKIIPHRSVAKEYTADNSGEFVTVLAMECRGIEITAWYPSFDFSVESSGGLVFPHDKVDLSDRDWADYDEENDLSVSISNLDYRIEMP